MSVHTKTMNRFSAILIKTPMLSSQKLCWKSQGNEKDIAIKINSEEKAKQNSKAGRIKILDFKAYLKL